MTLDGGNQRALTDARGNVVLPRPSTYWAARSSSPRRRGRATRSWTSREDAIPGTAWARASASAATSTSVDRPTHRGSSDRPGEPRRPHGLWRGAPQAARNLKSQVFHRYDPAGPSPAPEDFKGNAQSSRLLTRQYRTRRLARARRAYGHRRDRECKLSRPSRDLPDQHDLRRTEPSNTLTSADNSAIVPAYNEATLKP
jgi:hypothetical protein